MPTQRSNAHIPDRMPVRGEGDLVVVEAPTAEEALDRLTQFLGPDVDIIAAEKVARGGIAGFFAREMIQLTAQPPSTQAPARTPAHPAAPAAEPPAEPPAAAPPPAVPAHLARLLATRSEEAPPPPAGPPAPEPTFAEVLRQQLGLPSQPATIDLTVPHPIPPELPPPAEVPQPARQHRGRRRDAAATQDQAPAPTDRPAEPARTPLALVPEIAPAPQAPAVPAPPAPAAPAPAAPALPPAHAAHARRRHVVTGSHPGTGPVAWSPDELVRLGLPFAFIRPVMDLDPADDLAWIRSLAEAAEPLCGPLPTGDFLLRGHGAEPIAAALAVPVLHRFRPVEGSICVAGVEPEAAQRLVNRLRGERWIHLVVGGGGAHGPGDPPPSVVSWVGRTRLPEVLHLSMDLAIPVGYFKSSARGAGVLRATPVEIALALRDLVVRQ